MSAERFSATSDTTDAATSITKGAGVEIAVEGLSINTVEGRGHPGRAVLSDVHLNVTRGAALAIVGPSGAGKTTLVRSSNWRGGRGASGRGRQNYYRWCQSPFIAEP